MPAHDEADAVAVLLPGPEAARATVALWEAGQAVVPLDPAAPEPDLRRSFSAVRPTALIDRDGRPPSRTVSRCRPASRRSWPRPARPASAKVLRGE